MIRLAGPAVTTANLELVTLVELHTFRGTTGQSADNTRLQQIVDGVNRRAYDRMRQRFIKHNSTNWDIVLDGQDPKILPLPYRPIAAFTSIQAGFYDDTGWTTQHVYTSNEFVRDDEEGLLTNVSTGWSTAPNSLRAIWQAGWTAAPADLKQALLEVMSVEYERASAQRLDMTSRTDDSGANTYTFTTWPAFALEVLDRYTYKAGWL